MSDVFITSPSDADAQQVLDPYPAARKARRTKLAVSWESKGIARDLAPHLVGLTYVDNLSGSADDLSIELEDREDLWSGDWRPEFGDTVVARLEAEAWFGNKVTSLRLGRFAHDKISLSGPPHRVNLQCVSAVLASGLRRRKRTRVWQGVSLKQIAKDIADRAQLSLDFNGSAGPPYKKAIQNDKSDLEFLQEQCKEAGRTMKVTEDAIVIYDEFKLDQGDAVGAIDLRLGNVVSWSFDGDDSGRYGSCHVTCFNPATGKTVKAQFPRDGETVEGLDENGQTLELVINISDEKEAAARAKALLRNANRFATSGRITTIGDPGLVAGVVFDLKGAGSLDGKFVITRAEHRPIGGYTCDLTVRRCLESF